MKHKHGQHFYDIIALALIAAGFALLVGLIVIVVLSQAANAGGARPCGMGGNNGENKRLVKCLAKQPGIKVERAKAVSIARCESGFNDEAHAHPYHGIYQLTHDEFPVFLKQGPKWVDDERKEYGYGIHSARGNILAALSHAHDHGWTWIGVCG